MKKILIISILFLSIFIFSCKKVNTDTEQPKDDDPVDVQKEKYNVEFYDNNEVLLKTIVVEEGNTINKEEVNTIDVSKEHHNFLYWALNGEEFSLDTKISSNLKLYATYELESFVSFKIHALDSVADRTNFKVTIDYEEDSEVVPVSFKVSNTKILQITKTGKNYCQFMALEPGEVDITATYEDYSATHHLTVTGAEYQIKYTMGEYSDILPSNAPTTYNTANFPVELPTLELEGFFFVGWRIGGYDGYFTTITKESKVRGDLVLYPKFTYPYLVASFDSSPVVGIDKTIKLNVESYEVPEEWLNGGFTYTASKDGVVSISDEGVITGLAEGYVEILVSLKNNPKVNVSIGVTVSSTIDSMNDLLKYFVELSKNEVIARNINVYTWQKTYAHELIGSVSPYLFEDFEVIENIAPLGYSRPGTIKPKYYICVHDTGDLAFSAYQWSKTVYNKQYDNGEEYAASFQYVVGNDGIYHNIPDNEVAWHAGDGTKVDYSLTATGVFGTNKYPVETISADGYFELDGKKTTYKAPTNNGAILTSSSIGDYGIRCILGDDGQYYMGPCYYNSTYRKISNYGGNNNSIGIESCINDNTDVYYTWQKLAKLVANLMENNNLSIDDVVTHHFFSGKDCPGTMRHANLWFYFKDLVVAEYNILQYLKDGYGIELSCDSEYVNNVGRIIKWPKTRTTISYTVTIKKGGTSESIVLSAVVPGKNETIN